MHKTQCPMCDAVVTLQNKPKLGQRVVCPGCDAALEVVWLDPLELDWPLDEYEDDFDSKEDFDYDYDYEDYEESA